VKNILKIYVIINSLCSSPPESTIDDRQTEIDFGEGESSVSGRGPVNKVFQDPSEPIYTEPSLFERARSLRSVVASDLRRVVHRTAEQPTATNQVPVVDNTESAAL